jgi:ribulose 1,5-bisphosphate carboxylase large subunit-like protein
MWRRRWGSPSCACTGGGIATWPAGLRPGATAQESAKLAAARQRIRDLEEEVKILRKAAAAVEAVVPQNTGTAWSQNSTVEAGRRPT